MMIIKRGAFGSISSKRQVLRRDKDAERLEDKKEAIAEGGRRFQREGRIAEKDLDYYHPMMTMVIFKTEVFVCFILLK